MTFFSLIDSEIISWKISFIDQTLHRIEFNDSPVPTGITYILQPDKQVLAAPASSDTVLLLFMLRSFLTALEFPKQFKLLPASVSLYALLCMC